MQSVGIIVLIKAMPKKQVQIIPISKRATITQVLYYNYSSNSKEIFTQQIDVLINSFLYYNYLDSN